jgi:hypothetical protein
MKRAAPGWQPDDRVEGIQRHPAVNVIEENASTACPKSAKSAKMNGHNSSVGRHYQR